MSSDNDTTLKRSVPTSPALSKKAKVSEDSASSTTSPAVEKVLTFTADHDKFARLQLLSKHTLYDLVATLCKWTAVGYEGSEGPNDHLWDIIYNGIKYASMNSAGATKLEKLQLVAGRSLVLEYDYGSTSTYKLSLDSSEDFTEGEEGQQLYPRNLPMSDDPDSFQKFVPDGDFNLDMMFGHLQKFIFEGSKPCKVNLFQAGSKKNYGFVDRDYDMMFLAAKPDTLTDWLECFDEGAIVNARKFRGYTWHSNVIVPHSKMTSQLEKKYGSEEPGFCDFTKVDESDSDVVTRAFPKIAALAGLKKDKKVKKGWISLSKTGNSYNLSICSGKTWPHKSDAPVGTAYDGKEQHNPVDKPLFTRPNIKICGLHDLFCEVEGLLRTL